MALYRLWSRRNEKYITARCSSPSRDLATDETAQNPFRSGKVQSPKRERFGFPEDFESPRLRSHVARSAQTPAPRPKRLQNGQATARKEAERPAKIYIYICMFFRQQKVYLVTFMPKTGTLQNQLQITRQEPCDWSASHRTCFWLKKARYTWFCLLRVAFNCF